MKKIYKQSFFVWFILLIFAMINGTIRAELYQNFLGELKAHQLSSLLAVLGFYLIIYLFLKISRAEYDKKDLWIIGLAWVLATIIFEFSFGHFVVGHTWGKLFVDYNIFAGRLWGLVLLSIFIAPLLLDNFINLKFNRIMKFGFVLVMISFLILSYRIFLGGAEDYWFCKNNEWQKHGQPMAPIPNYSCEEKEDPGIKQLSDWDLMVAVIKNCEAKMIMQAHSLEVSADLKDGRTIYAIEPEIDKVIRIALEAREKCGEIIIATE